MKIWGKVVVAVAVVGVAIQFLPFGHTHTNPPTTAEPQWDSPQTRQLFARACFDCHSNNTQWPWYSHVAPMSWLVARDVNDGRRHVNFSEWDQASAKRHAEHVTKEVESGDMPLWFYLPMHPKARLSADEKQALTAGAAKSLGVAQETGPDKD